MLDASLQHIAKALKEKKISSVELTREAIDRAKKRSDLNALTHLCEDQAMAQAKTADKHLAQGQGGPLTGIPMAHKDIFCTQGLPTTCASKMLADFVSPYNATVVEKLQSEGGVMIGKTNMDEFAMGSKNENSFFGPVKNPHDLKRCAGGSSGGSAAVVAASIAPYATGTDTGGSIRLPAAYCGITGLKPTYGTVSRFGMVAFASSMDQAGPMAKSAEDLMWIMNAMSGHDPRDSTSLPEVSRIHSQVLNKPMKGLKIGLPNSFLTELNPEIVQAVKKAIKIFEAEGAELIEINLATQPLWVPCYYVIACAEASSNLARYDGVRYGYRSKSADTLQEMIQKSRSEGFGDEVKRRILTGTFVLSAGYFDDYFLKALKVRRLISQELNQALKKVDVIVGPTAPSIAPFLGERTSPVEVYMADMYTVAANLSGLPAVSLPMGASKSMPLGLQLMAGLGQEGLLLRVAHQLQWQGIGS